MSSTSSSAETRRSIETGMLFSPGLAEWFASHGDVIDVVSLVPEMLWHEGAGAPRYRWIEGAGEAFEDGAASKPVVLHGVGLSIGSGIPLDAEHVDQVSSVADRYGARWYSEHLAAFRLARDETGSAHAGIGLPVPFDAASLRELVPKVAEAVRRAGLPVLLENSAIYVEVPGQEMTEAGFMNRLSEEAGSGVLLDLHNLYVNEVNLGWDAEAYLAELDLDNVVEVHVAGGEMLGAWYTDAHSGECPERVWELLGAVVRSAPALRLVTFEMHESRLPVVGDAGALAQLARIRAVRDGADARVA